MDCSFCGVKIPKGTEYIYVTSKGKALYFCAGKCLKNMVKLKRKPRKVKWTKAYEVEKAGRVKTTKSTPKESVKEMPKPVEEASSDEAPVEGQAKKEVKPKKKKPVAEDGKAKATPKKEPAVKDGKAKAETKKKAKKAKKKA